MKGIHVRMNLQTSLQGTVNNGSAVQNLRSSAGPSYRGRHLPGLIPSQCDALGVSDWLLRAFSLPP
jgi:hypothetical protein